MVFLPALRLTPLVAVIKKLALGLILIAASAGVLLYSDLASRRGHSPTATSVFTVALVQHASQVVIDDGVRGVLEALKARGYEDGGRLRLRMYNAQGDVPTANAIAREITTGGNDLLITVTTVSLQTVANVNKTSGQTRHVFGLVTDPYSAGVGISRENHRDHPPYLTGYGTMGPIARTFALAREMRPELKRVGLVWNPAESNSVAQTTFARQVCAELGITLVEANAENSGAVSEAASSLVARGVEAIWISGDVTILVAAETIINVAKRARIPVFSTIPPTADKGGLFDIGADYVEIGRQLGQLAADVLEGKSPADVPVENLVPEMTVVNRLALDGLKDRWQIPDAVAATASVVIDAAGRHVKARTVDVRPLARKMKVELIEYLDTPNVEITRAGIMDGLKTTGLQEGRDYQLRRRNAQGDMTTLSGLIDAAVTDKADLIIAATTPALQAALRRGRNTPLIFTVVANPVLAGAGKSDTDHLPFVTGAYIPAPHEEALAILKQVLPNAKRLGTLFVPAEVNSEYYKQQLEGVATRNGYHLESVGVSTSGEVADAALALCSRQLDVFCQISDNLTGASFTSVAEAAKRYKLPLLGFAQGQADKGAFMTVSRDYYDGGVETARLIARVLRGENTATIPFTLVSKITYTYNLPVAAQLGIRIPPALLAKADRIIR